MIKKSKKDARNMVKIGERIRNLRQLNKLTQEELAERANLTKGFISQIERDLTSISLDSLIQILEALDENISDFFREASEETTIYREKDRVAIEKENMETLEEREEVKKWASIQTRRRKLYDKTCGQILEGYVKTNFEPGREFTRDQILAWFHQHYSRLDAKTVECHVMKYTTNYLSRMHHGAKPEHDLIFRMADDWNRLRLYQPDIDPTPIYKDVSPEGGEKKPKVPKLSPLERHRRILAHVLTYGEITPEEVERIGVHAEDIAAWQDSLLVARPGTMVVSPLFLWASEGGTTSSGFTTRLVIRMIGNQLDGSANNPIESLEGYVWEHLARWHVPQPHPGDEKWHGYLYVPNRETADFTASEKLDLFSHLPPPSISELLKDSGFQTEQQKWSAAATAKEDSLGPLSRQVKFGVRRPLFLSEFQLREMQGRSITLSILPASDVLLRLHVISGLPLCMSEEWDRGGEVSVEELQNRLLNHPLYAAIVQFEVHRMNASLSGDVSTTLCVHSDGNCLIDIPGRDNISLWSACKELLAEMGYWPVSWSTNDSHWKAAVRVALSNLERIGIMEPKGETLRLTESFESRIKAHPGHPQNRGEKDFRIRLQKFLESEKGKAL